jgi:hypothetical protein
MNEGGRKAPWYVRGYGAFLILFAVSGAIGSLTYAGGSVSGKMSALAVSILLIVVGVGLIASSRWAWFSGILVALVGILLGALPLVTGAANASLRAVAVWAYLIPGTSCWSSS